MYCAGGPRISMFLQDNNRARAQDNVFLQDNRVSSWRTMCAEGKEWWLGGIKVGQQLSQSTGCGLTDQHQLCNSGMTFIWSLTAVSQQRMPSDRLPVVMLITCICCVCACLLLWCGVRGHTPSWGMNQLWWVHSLLHDRVSRFLCILPLPVSSQWRLHYIAECNFFPTNRIFISLHSWTPRDLGLLIPFCSMSLMSRLLLECPVRLMS